MLEANPRYRPLAFPQSSDPALAGLVREMRGKPLPQVGTIELAVIEEMQPRVLAFQRGQLDIATLRGSGAQALMRNGAVDPALASRGVRPHTYGGLLWGWFVRNRAPHTDWRVPTGAARP